jgi:hypothetical protein
MGSWGIMSPPAQARSFMRGTATTPNPRLQRTRMRAPLSRKPLGDVTLVGQ